MPKIPSNLHSSQKRLVHAVQQEMKRVRTKIEPGLLARPEPQWAHEETRNLQYAQNVLRTCMEATLQMMMPYSHSTAGELAIRLASYAISTVPLEDQEVVVADFLSVFADAHQRRTAQGIVIATDWKMEDGREQPNFPKAGR